MRKILQAVLQTLFLPFLASVATAQMGPPHITGASVGQKPPSGPMGTIFGSALASRPADVDTATVSIFSEGVVPVYSSTNVIEASSWISIYGTNLAPAAMSWSGNFPETLGGVSVTINNRPGYLWFVSPGQINLQAPDDPSTGSVTVVVTTPSGSATSTVTLSQFGPSFSLLDATHVAGVIVRTDGSGTQGGGTYDILGPGGSALPYITVPAKAGDSVVLYGVGFGPTNPVVPAGQVYSGAAPAVNPVGIMINGTVVTPSFAGLSAAGLFQFNLTIPAGLGTGDIPLVGMVGGVETPKGVVISLQ